jgi:hypothetical protein
VKPFNSNEEHLLDCFIICFACGENSENASRIVSRMAKRWGCSIRRLKKIREAAQKPDNKTGAEVLSSFMGAQLGRDACMRTADRGLKEYGLNPSFSLLDEAFQIANERLQDQQQVFDFFHKSRSRRLKS